MPGFLLHKLASAQCPHQALVNITPTQTRVTVSTQFVATASSALTVAGCLFQVPIPAPPGTKPQPCVRVQWALMSARVRVNFEAVLLQPSLGSGPGSCLSVEQIPAGPPTVSAMQQRVIGS
jgi:hypothetical protein